MVMLADIVEIVIGVDTHKHTHTAAALTASTGAVIDQITVTTNPDGYAQLLEWAEGHSTLRAWAIEGCGGYGAGLTRVLDHAHELVAELDRPTRPQRHNGAKSDPIDAVRAARDALGREHLGQPRTGPERAALAVLVAARRSAVQARADAHRQLHALVVTAPEALRARLRAVPAKQLPDTAARLRCQTTWDLETRTSAAVLKSLGRRCRDLAAEARQHEHEILAIVRSWRPDLLDQHGIGPINAAIILCAWSHPGRCRNEAAFASLAGASPIPASSGQTTRHRLNRSGDRQLNRALHIITLHRLRHDPATRAYAERRRAEGRTDREIRRCLKRYIARQLYRQLEHHPLDPQ
jgi:transposase